MKGKNEDSWTHLSGNLPYSGCYFKADLGDFSPSGFDEVSDFLGSCRVESSIQVMALK